MENHNPLRKQTLGELLGGETIALPNWNLEYMFCSKWLAYKSQRLRKGGKKDWLTQFLFAQNHIARMEP